MAEDLCATHTEAMHDFAFAHILARLGRVAKAGDIELRR